ncbi:unnamed protein product [Linum trigynum]|uniref:Uncharacterized protein n=1 Tax=Linum trigynum TaxID=586398 RepID=A0AAV2DI54_9ROSI
MSSVVQSNVALPAATAPAGGEQRRIQTTEFHETVWGDHFLTTTPAAAQAHDEMYPSYPFQGNPVPDLENGAYEALKEEVRRMVTGEVDDDDDVAIIRKLRLMDTIQRLGVEYHFQMEIEAALQNVYLQGGEFFLEKYDDIDLCNAALWFRLLRQQGFRVSTDGFRRFKDDGGKFKESLASDAQGLLSLYEASHVAIHGEDILDEARGFTTKNLKLLVQDHKTSSLLKKQIEFSLDLPIWKCVPRTITRHCIEVYSESDQQAMTHNEAIILKFAKLDFNFVQRVHQEELRELSMWWASLDTKTKFPYAKDRLTETYFWINTVYHEPRYSVGRSILTKCGVVSVLLDDVYDNFGNYDELEMLTEAIQRMDISALDELPATMKEAYRIVIVNLLEEIEQAISGTGPTYGVDYCKRELKRMCRSFLGEARWRTEGHVPKLEEYLTHANITGGYFFLCPSAYLGMEPELATREAFEWIADITNKMVMASTSICRVQNDIMSYPFEQKRSHVASAVQCYMKEHGVSEEEATKAMWGRISDAWKDMTEVYCQKPTPLPRALLLPVINFARTISVIYLKADAYTHPQFLRQRIADLFVNPVPL